MPRPKKHREPSPAAQPGEDGAPVGPLRIIGGSMRGRKLQYSGRGDTRPMKERVRESMFNLIGPAIKGLHVLDLFAGTGAIGLEAISRGAARATFIERHVPTAKLIRENIAGLGVADLCEVISANALIWTQQPDTLPAEPWGVFISPPWEMFQSEAAAMLDLVSRMKNQSPPGSLVIVEANMEFDLEQLPEVDLWRMRAYPPAVIAIWEQPRPEIESE